MNTNFDEQDVLFNILDRNEIKEVRAFIAFSQFGRETIEVEVTPKRKFPIIYEPALNDHYSTVHHLIWSICEGLTWKQADQGEYGFVVTFFSKNRKVTVDELGT